VEEARFEPVQLAELAIRLSYSKTADQLSQLDGGWKLPKPVIISVAFSLALECLGVVGVNVGVRWSGWSLIHNILLTTHL